MTAHQFELLGAFGAGFFTSFILAVMVLAYLVKNAKERK